MKFAGCVRPSGLIVSALDSGERVQALARPRTQHCLLGQDTLLSQYLSPSRCILGTGKFNAGGSPVMD